MVEHTPKAPVKGTTLVRRRLGRHLRQLREASDRSMEDVCVAGLGSRVKIWRIESGHTSVKVAEAKELARLYGANEMTVEAMGALAAETYHRGGWVEGDSGTSPPGFSIYVDLEREANHIRVYHGELVPGLLQTPDYAMAVERRTRLDPDEETVRQTVKIRQERQRYALDRQVRITAVLGASTLARMVGDSDAVIADQISHLVMLDGLSHVEIRIVPWKAGGHPGMVTGAFHILEFDNPDDPPVVYLEDLSGGHYLERDDQVERVRRIYGAILECSIPIKEAIR